MMSQAGTQTITLYLLPDISESKDNQTMEFGQLIEHNVRNIFLRKSCRKWGGETSSRPIYDFLKSFIWICFDSSWLGHDKSKLYETS